MAENNQSGSILDNFLTLFMKGDVPPALMESKYGPTISDIDSRTRDLQDLFTLYRHPDDTFENRHKEVPGSVEEKDALRHLYGTLYTKDKHGYTASILSGILHEYENLVSDKHPLKDIMPDLYNNFAGLFGSGEQSELIDKVMAQKKITDEDYEQLLKLAEGQYKLPPEWSGPRRGY